MNIYRKSIPSRGNSRCGGPETSALGDRFEEEPGSQVVMGREVGMRSGSGDVPPLMNWASHLTHHLSRGAA